MTTTKTHDVARDARRRSSAWPRPAARSSASPCPGVPDADALPRIVARLAAAGDRRHPLQRLAGAARDRRGRGRRAHQPRQHRRPRQGRAGRAAGAGGRDADAHRRQLRARCPSTCARSRRPTRPARSSRRRWRRCELLERLDFREFKISVKARVGAGDDRGLPAPLRARAVSAAPRRDRGRDRRSPAPSRAPIGIGSLLARRHRRHDPRLAHRPTRSRRSRSAGRSCARSACASKGPELIACPSCGRTNVEVLELAEQVEARLAHVRRASSRWP